MGDSLNNLAAMKLRLNQNTITIIIKFFLSFLLVSHLA